MIFVTIGASKICFDRLIKEMDFIAGKIDENVIMQVGITRYLPINAEYFGFLPRNEIDDYYKNARIIVCHAGIGTILTALEYGKHIIVVPRLKEFGEHHDNHQLEIAKELEKERKIMAIYDINELENALWKVCTHPINFEIEQRRIRLINVLKIFIESLDS